MKIAGRILDRTKRASAGLTLLELVVAVSLLGIVGLAFGVIYGNAQRYMVQSISFSATQGEVSFAVEHIRKQMLQTVEITAPAEGAAAAAQMTFQRLPTLGAARITSQYQVTSGALRFYPDTVNAAGTFEVVARSVTAVTFTRASRSNVTVDITTQRTTGNTPAQQTNLVVTLNARGVF